MSIHYDKLCQRVNIIPIFRVHNLHFDLITIQYLNGYSVGEFFFFFFIILTFASQKLVRSYIIGERKEIRLPRIYKEYLPVDLPRQCHR